MATTPIGGRLPNSNRKGISPCTAIPATPTGVGDKGGNSITTTTTTSSSSSSNHSVQSRCERKNSREHHQQVYQEQSGRRQSCEKSGTKKQAGTVAANAVETDTAATNATNNFEYDDNEWDIGIGDLIIDLDADIEKTRDEKLSSGNGMASTPASAPSATSTNQNHQVQQQNSSATQNSSSSTIISSGNGQSSASLSLSCSSSSSAAALPSCGVNSSSVNSANSVGSGNASANTTSATNTNNNSTGNGPIGKQQPSAVNAVHTNAGNPGKMAVEHSATVDKGLKMKIKRTKPGTKTSEAKHEIVKSNEINGTSSSQDATGNSSSSNSSSTSSTTSSTSSSTASSQNSIAEVTSNNNNSSSSSNKSKPHSPASAASGAQASSTAGSKRGSSGHRRDKARDKHDKQPQSNHAPQQNKPEMNGTARPVSQTQNSTGNSAAQSQGPTPAATAPQQTTQGPPPTSRTGFPVVQGAGPPATSAAAPCPPPSPASATVAGSAAKPEQTKVAAVPGPTLNTTVDEAMDTAACSPPPTKKLKTSNQTEPKDMSDVCVGTSVGTITEPECLGPCEPGTAVTLEGIVWHETEGGVLVVNVTWRGKTYVGTLLDCTRHDWAPPRFCDSPTSDLDARTPKGRGKRGRAAANATPGNDLSNFTETRSSVHSKLRNGGAKGRRGAQGSPAASPSPAAFVPPRPDPAAKRKSRGPEEEEKSKRRAATTAVAPPAAPQPTPIQTPPSGSPPASPVLIECPEPNCSKKYKNINGLKYHQSHAHGSADDDDTKEGITSMSENDESNIEAPSPATPVKSPADKPEGTPVRPTSPPMTVPPETPPPPRVPSPSASEPTPTPILADKTSIVKPGVLRFGQDDLPVPAIQSSPRPPPVQPTLVQPVQSAQPLQPVNAPQSPSPHPSQSPRPVPSPHLTTNIPQPITIPQPPQPSQIVQQHQVQNQLLQAPQALMSQPQQQQPLSQPQTLPSPQPAQIQPAHQIPIQHTPQLGQQPAPAHMVHQTPLPQQPVTVPVTCQSQQATNLQTLSQHPGMSLPTQLTQQSPGLQNSAPGHPIPSHIPQYPSVGLHGKMPQFKVKPTAALMPEQDKTKDPRTPKSQSYKKKSRKSPGGSPHPSPMEAPMVDPAREDVQSPAYSDISDDAAPVLESELADKAKQGQEKDVKPGAQTHLPPHFSMYPYYGQPPYLVPNVQDKQGDQKPSDLTPKQELKPLNIPQMPSMASLQNPEKDKKELNPPPQQAHYYGGYGTYIPSGYPYQPQPVSQPPPQQQQQQQQVPPPSQQNDQDLHDQKSKIKQEPQQLSSMKDKQHENHQILKESIEMKSQMSPYHVYHGQNRQSAPAPVQDDRRYYLYPGEQRRKDEVVKAPQQAKPPPPSPKHQSKQEKPQDLGKSDDSKNKQEGVKPTMETQGPPPPPTSQYAYIHPGAYMPPQHYGGLPFDPSHPVYRGLSPIMVPGPYSTNPYLHQIPRYHAPEDLSRPPGGKALDLLQHHANQYYSTHKIHELQERALKSPTPKTSAASASPSAVGPTPARPPSGPPTSVAGPGPPPGQGQQQGNKQQVPGGGNPQQSAPGDAGNGGIGKDSRSPPPQRHVHTHHHTHVGLGYPLLTGQYPAPYGAAVLASQQAAAVAASVISPFPPK